VRVSWAPCGERAEFRFNYPGLAERHKLTQASYLERACCLVPLDVLRPAATCLSGACQDVLARCLMPAAAAQRDL